MRKFGVFIGIMAIFVALLVLLPLIDSWGVKFKDPRLEAAIKTSVGKRDAPYIRITRSDFAKIHYLDISGRNVRSLAGIERLTKLVTLNASNNTIESVSPLAKLPNLKGLNLSNNGFSSLDDIGFEEILHLPLVELDLSDNGRWPLGDSLSMLSDVSMIVRFSDLEELFLNNIALEDASFLSNLKQLKVLEIGGTNVDSIEFLNAFTAMRELNLRGTPVRDIAPLAQLQNLRYLNLHSCSGIMNLEVLGKLSRLETLIIPNVDLSAHTDAITSMKSLRRLNIRNTGIANLDFLFDIPFIDLLEEVDIRENPLPVPTIEYDPYAPVRDNWKSIQYRYPQELPGFLITPPIFSHVGGQFPEPFMLELSSAIPGVAFYYTVDGSIPDPENVMSDEQWGNLPRETKERTFRYDGPIDLARLIDRPNDISMISTGIPGLVEGYYSHVEPKVSVGKIVVVRASTVVDGKISEAITHSYVCKGGEGEDRLPIISITTPRANLFDSKNGIYVSGEQHVLGENGTGNYYLKGRASSRPAHIELISGLGPKQIGESVTIRIHGNWSRRYPQKSLRIIFNEDTGDKPIEYKFFEKSEITTFNTLILRNAGSDWGEGMMRDVISQEMVRHLDFDMQDFLPVEVYINGEFWGYHNLRERQDEFYFHNKYGLPVDEITLLEANGSVGFGKLQSSKQFVELVHKANAMTLKELEDLIDIPNFLTYNMLQLYSGNTDWPHNNIQYWRYEGGVGSLEKGPFDGRWRWILQDLDHSFGYIEGPGFDMIEYMFETDNNKFAINRDLFLAVLDHGNLLENFLQGLAMHLNTTFSGDRVVQLITEHAKKIEPIMPLQYERWGWPSQRQWQDELKEMLEYASERPMNIRAHVLDFFPKIEGLASLEIHNVPIDSDISIEAILLDETTPGVQIVDGKWKGEFFGDIPIEITSSSTRLDQAGIFPSEPSESIVVHTKEPHRLVLELKGGTSAVLSLF